MKDKQLLLESKAEIDFPGTLIETNGEEEIQSVLNYGNDDEVSDDFNKLINTIKNSDIELQNKTHCVGEFNTKYYDKYHLEIIFLINNMFSAKLVCVKTNLELESFASSFVSFTEAKKIKRQFFPSTEEPPQLGLEFSEQRKIATTQTDIISNYHKVRNAFFNRENRCITMVTSVGVGLAVAGYAYLAKEYSS